MTGYLLDTSVLSILFNEKDPRYARVKARFDALPSEAPVFVSAVTLGEVEYGHRCVSPEDTDTQRRFARLIEKRFPSVLAVDGATRHAYGRLRASLFERFAPHERKGKTKRPEELTDPTTAKQLGIQENDVWLAAQAIERKLVLVTADRMTRIKEAAGDDLQVENWTAP